MTDRPLRIGIVGANWTLAVHAPAWRMVPGCEVTAICTAHEDTALAAAKEAGIEKPYWDNRKMAEDPDIDVIVVGTSPATRYDIVMAALEGGKHVYNCIPFAVSAEKARAMHAAQQKHGLVGMVDAQFRHLPAMRYIRDCIADGALGNVIQATMDVQMGVYRHEGFHYPLCAFSGSMKPYHWLADSAAGGSAWRNFGSHAILNLMPIFGEIDTIIGDAQTVMKEWRLPSGHVLHPDTHDSAMALVRFRNGGRANINTGWAKADSLPLRFEIWGTEGRFLLEDHSFGAGPGATVFYGDARKKDEGAFAGGLVDIPDEYYTVAGTSLTRDTYYPYLAPMADMFSQMADAIRNGGSGSPNFAEAAHAHCAVEAMLQSMESECWTKVEA